MGCIDGRAVFCDWCLIVISRYLEGQILFLLVYSFTLTNTLLSFSSVNSTSIVGAQKREASQNPTFSLSHTYHFGVKCTIVAVGCGSLSVIKCCSLEYNTTVDLEESIELPYDKFIVFVVVLSCICRSQD